MLRCYYISNCWSVYGLRKVLLGKDILIFLGKNLTVLMSIKNTFLILEIHFTYKFVIPDTKKNKIFFRYFWNISQVLMALINWLLKSNCMLKHIFFEILLYENTIWFFFFERLGRMHENKIFFLFYNFFVMFRRKSGILILDLYLYGIKIQTNIKQSW